MPKAVKLKIIGSTVVALILGISAVVYFDRGSLLSGNNSTAALNDAKANKAVAFDLEAYDQIRSSYWMAPSGYDLAEMFRVALSGLTNTQATLPTHDRAGVETMLTKYFDTIPATTTQADIALNVVNVLTYKLLQPVGRNRLLSFQQNIELSQTVSNIHPENDLYKNVGAAPGATVAEVKAKYEEKAKVLEKVNTPEAKKELADATYAKKVLTDTATKNLYDTAKIEPTVFTHTFGSTLYLYISQISPTTLQEFGHAVEQASDTPGLSSMIIDLRGNIGGDFAFAQNFLGLFIGPNQYAFDIFHQGDYKPQRTTQPKWTALGRFREMVLMTDSGTRSTAEAVSAAFERYHLATVVGTKTAGWGTVENHSYEMKTVLDPHQKFILELVEYLVLGAENQPIEVNGVTPVVDTSKPDWSTTIQTYVHSPSLLSAVKKVSGGVMK